MSSAALKEFYEKRDKELRGKKGSMRGGIAVYAIYDEEGNLVTKNKEGVIQQTITLPSYRPISLEEREIMEKERQDNISAATKAYDDAFDGLHDEYLRKDRSLQKIMELNRQMVEADHRLQNARFPVQYVTHEDGVEIRRIDFNQPAEVRKLTYSIASLRVSPFPLQQMYVREGKAPEASSASSSASSVSFASAVKDKPVLFIQDATTNEYGFMALDWPVQIRLRSVTYHSAKQALAAELAKAFADDEGFRRAMDAESPAEVSYTLEQATEEKKEVTPDTWAAATKRFVYEIQQAKFNQYPELQGRLLSTGDAVLAVYQPGDELLGIGIPTEDVHAKNPIYWKGQNLLGSALMEIRSKFREAQQAPSASLIPAVVPKKKFSVRRPVVAASSAPFIITNHISGHETAIPGLYYIPNALTVAQEKELIDYLDGPQATWEGVTESSTARRVQHYGYRYDYKRRTVSGPTHLIPEQWKSVIGLGYQWNQVIVNEYDPGQGISAHIDAPVYGDTIICYTLGSGAMMRFTKPETGEVVDLYVAPRSVYIMSDVARYGWKHEMISRKTNTVDGKTIPRSRRISVTLRWVPEGSLASASSMINDEKKESVEIIGTVFTKPGEYGDFEWQIKSGKYEDSLFIFNDSEEYHTTSKAGKGNAVIRKYNKYSGLSRPRSAGISTGRSIKEGGYKQLDERTKMVIDKEVEEARTIIKQYGYKRVFYSADATGKLGTSLFVVSPDVIDYITQKIRSLSL